MGVEHKRLFQTCGSALHGGECEEAASLADSTPGYWACDLHPEVFLVGIRSEAFLGSSIGFGLGAMRLGMGPRVSHGL